MTGNSRTLFNQLVGSLSISESIEEKEAIIYLLLDHLGLSRTDVTVGKTITYDEATLLTWMKRLNQHEPVQYILGEADFYRRKFSVKPSVLIPRPETELLIQTVVNRFRGSEKPITIIDIGTGSGCIAITLALELPQATVLATDISAEALTTAKKNADQLKASVQFHLHDILTEPLSFGKLDAIVSNPPYVMMTEKTAMKQNVVDFEPHTALFVPDNDPLVFYKAIATKAHACLKPGGFLAVEINETLGTQVDTLFQKNGFENGQIIQDLSGKERIVKTDVTHEI
ncbi:MAG: peptide chain release factor N(5)-glutamine methyltransferase [Cyclobacteriaceae bacterium]|nr:peptide chain release factor N(5)-glutamine methyltransferase [Cyclobacteriaceae bacterium]